MTSEGTCLSAQAHCPPIFSPSSATAWKAFTLLLSRPYLFIETLWPTLVSRSTIKPPSVIEPLPKRLTLAVTPTQVPRNKKDTHAEPLDMSLAQNAFISQL